MPDIFFAINNTFRYVILYITCILPLKIQVIF
nr:MAG TPA: hypothetical protein [Caudoviricetes sp.]